MPTPAIIITSPNGSKRYIMITVLFGRKSNVSCTAAVTDYSRNMPLRRTAPYLEKTFENTAPECPSSTLYAARFFLFLFHHITSIRTVEFFRPTIGFVNGKKKTDVLRSRNLFLAPRRRVMGSGCSYCFGGLFFFSSEMYKT